MVRSRNPSKPPKDEITVEEIPLASPPSWGGPRSDKDNGGVKPLLQILEENRPRNADGTPIQPIWRADEELKEGPGEQAFFMTVPLCMLLFCFDAIVHQQYRQEIEFWMIFNRVVKAVPAIFILLYFFHPRNSWRSVQALFFTISVVVGCWVVHSVNRHGYYAVMKKVPPLGTLWVWSFVEMELALCLVSCFAVGGFVWWGGYSIL